MVVNKYGSVCHGYRSFFYGTLHMWARIDEEHNVKEKMISFQTWKKLSNIIQWLVDLLSHGDTWHAGMYLEVNFLIGQQRVEGFALQRSPFNNLLTVQITIDVTREHSTCIVSRYQINITGWISKSNWKHTDFLGSSKAKDIMVITQN
jgi:hypothetical protein